MTTGHVVEPVPDRRADPSFLDRSVKHIPDPDLFASLDLRPPPLEAVAAAARQHDYATAYNAWSTYWSVAATARGRFVDDAGLIATREETTDVLVRRRDSICRAADDVLAHVIRGWGEVTIRHGPAVDFTADYGRAGRYGFHYWGWAKPLVDAFLLTGDPRYLVEFDALFNGWYEQRDNVRGEVPGLDAIWNELGLGLRSRVFVEGYCLRHAGRSIVTHERMLKTLLGAGRWLFEEENRKYRGGNWQFMGSYGLALIGLMVPEFAESAAWVRLGALRVAEHVERDFFPDGCHSERVPSSYMLTAYKDARNLARLLGEHAEHAELAARIRVPLERTLNWFVYALAPDGYLPAINDGSRTPFPARLMHDGADLFARPDAAYVAEHLLGGADRAVSCAPTAHEPARRSVHFPASGFTVMRSDWSRDALYLLINHGPSGGAHSHADVLSFQLHAFGRALCVDSGIGRTYDDPNHQPWYVTPHAHNMLTVGQHPLDRRTAAGADVRWHATSRLEYFAATHHGYHDSAGVTHRRHIAFVRSRYFVIYDVATAADAAGERALTWNLHSTVPLQPTPVSFASPTGPGLLVVPSSAEWTARTDTGWTAVTGIPGYHTDEAQIPWLMFDGRVGPGSQATLGVLLYPFRASPGAITFRELERDGAAAHFVVKHDAGQDHLLFGQPGRLLENDGITFDGDCALLSGHVDGATFEWAATGTRLLRVRGAELINAAAGFDRDGW